MRNAPLFIAPEAEIGAIPKIENFLSSTLSKGLAPSLYGAATEENPLTGALEGFAAGGVGHGIKSAPNLIEGLRPKKQAENLLETIGKGRNLEENAKSIAKDIREKFKENKNISGENYDLVFNTHGLGNRELPLSGIQRKTGIIPKAIVDTFDSKLENLYDDFLSSPTFKNAHELQSQLGSSIRKLQKQDQVKGLTLADQKILSKYVDAQNNIQEKLRSGLKSVTNEHGTPLSDLYDQANFYHVNNVVPYKETPNISKIATGKVKNPRNVQEIFKNPEEHVEKILGHLNDDFKNKILYSELGKHSSPEAILSASKKLDEKGLNTYLNPEISKQLDLLAQKTKSKNFARAAGGALGGAAVGHFLPFPLAKELAPVLGAVLASPSLKNALSAMFKGKGI